MKSLKTLQTLSKVGKILSKIMFVFSLIGVGGCVAGLLSIMFGNGTMIKIGDVTLHGILENTNNYNFNSISATLAAVLIICAGEAVLAKFAEIYFRNELAAGTPFTRNGANELLRLGILTIAIQVGCTALAEITQGIIAGFMNVEIISQTERMFDNESSIVLGIMFIIGSVLCRYGAETVE